jgi:hypothetical protein
VGYYLRQLDTDSWNEVIHDLIRFIMRAKDRGSTLEDEAWWGGMTRNQICEYTIHYRLGLRTPQSFRRWLDCKKTEDEEQYDLGEEVCDLIRSYWDGSKYEAERFVAENSIPQPENRYRQESGLTPTDLDIRGGDRS